MLDNILPSRIANALNKIPYKSLCELRMRISNPIVVNIMGENFYLSENSLVKDRNIALKVGDGVLQGIVQKLSNYSLYSINDQIINGYVTYDGGIRVGICGEVVDVDDRVKTIKNISSLNFRFPHIVKNCSLDVYPYIENGGDIKNTLIISPPGAGKTTMLRDIIYQLSERTFNNILVVDERQELSSVFTGNDVVKISNVDVYKNCSKGFAFNNGIRSMKPDIIVTDEINIERDMVDIENALTSGVKVVASVHASTIDDLKHKSGFKSVLNKNLFERFVVLSNSNRVGTIEGIYNENLRLIGM